MIGMILLWTLNDLANVVIGNLSFSQWDESADESADVHIDTDVSFAALNALKF